MEKTLEMLKKVGSFDIKVLMPNEISNDSGRQCDCSDPDCNEPD